MFGFLIYLKVMRDSLNTTGDRVTFMTISGKSNVQANGAAANTSRSEAARPGLVLVCPQHLGHIRSLLVKLH